MRLGTRVIKTPGTEPSDFGGRVFAASSVRSVLRAEAARFRFSETGGVLFGYRAGQDIVVTDATGPGPHAVHGRTFFKPDPAHCQAALESVYQRTGGTVSYLGEWHTHPHGTVRPSTQDARTMRGIAADEGHRQPEPLLWIYRRADALLPWYWSEDEGLWVFDASAPQGQKVSSLLWFDAT